MVLKNCEPELSYKPAELFNMCLKESSIPNYWKVSSVFPVFKNVRERSATKNYSLLSIISLVSNVFVPETLEYWVGVQWSQSYLTGRRWLFSLGWPHIW